MAEAAQGTQQEFWRPPVQPIEEVAVREPVVSMAEACHRCGTEFLLGSRFCHTCGSNRPAAMSSVTRADAAAVANVWVRCVDQVQSAVKALPLNKLPLNKLKLPAFGKMKAPAWLHYLHFHEIQDSVGLPTASLIAFVIGLACVAGALLVGLLTVKTFVDWQAIQFYRVEWLLAATAAFVAGILLKRHEHDDRD